MSKIDNYNADSITALEGLEAVRVRPEMYIGSTGKRGLNHLVYEIVDNAVDEHLAGFCTDIYVTLNKDGSCTVQDNGRGIPVDLHKKGIPAVRLVLTTLHAGGKFDNNSYKTAGGLHGVGSSVVNALSEYFIIDVSRDGKISHDEYKKGIPTVKLVNNLLPVIGKTTQTGTKITFLPDNTIFEKIRFGEEEIKSRLHQTAYLNPDLTIHYEDKRPGTEETITYSEKEGIIGFVKELTANSEKINDDVIYFKGTSEGITMEVAIQYTEDYHEDILGFCNNINTQEGGTHLTGFKTAYTSIMNNYAREIGVLKDKDENFSGNDVRSGMTAVISISHPSPRFEGQTKTKLDNADAQKAASKITNDELVLFLDKNLPLLKSILSKIEKAVKIRKAEEKVRKDFLPKQKFSFDSNGKLSNCESRDPSICEIFIVEGDSAGGSAKMARDRYYQAILPIRGKILNVEKASVDKVLANAEIKTMVYAFNCGFMEGYGQDFDINKLRYDKIVIMADADVDGSHICTLILTLFYRFMPELITTGHVYIAMPPLYKAIPTRGESEYLYDDDALIKYRKKHKNFTLQRYKGLGEMDAEQLWETTLNPATRVLKRVNIDDARRANELTSVLMGNDVEPRKEFIIKNSNIAELDI